MKTHLLVYALLIMCAHQSFSQTWVPQGSGLLPYGYKVNDIDVVDDTVIWVSASLRLSGQNYPVKVFRSVDAGQTWESHDIAYSGPSSSGPNNAYLAARSATGAWLTIREEGSLSGKLYTTDDGGRHWEVLLSDPAARGPAQIYDAQHMTCTFYNNIAWSADSGENWEHGSLTHDVAGNVAGAFTIFGDTTWTGQGYPDGQGYFWDPPESPMVQLVRSTEFGRHHRAIDCNIDSIGAIGPVVFSSHRHGIMKYRTWEPTWDWDLNIAYWLKKRDFLATSSDGGDTWTPVSSPMPCIIAIANIPDLEGAYAMAGSYHYPGQGEIISLTLDNGITWSLQHVPYDVCCLDFSSPVAGWAAVNTSAGDAPLVLKWNSEIISANEEIPLESGLMIHLFPNPARDKIHFSFQDHHTSGCGVILTDAAGRLIRKYETTDRALDIAHLPSGVYFLKIEHRGRQGIAKFVKE